MKLKYLLLTPRAKCSSCPFYPYINPKIPPPEECLQSTRVLSSDHVMKVILCVTTGQKKL